MNDIRSGIKPNAEVFVLYSGMKISEFPRALRLQQSFDADEKDSFEKLYQFIKNALGTTAPPISEPLPKAPVAKEVKPTAKQPLAPKSKRLLTIALSLALVFGCIALWGKRAGTDSVTNGNSNLLTYDKGSLKQMTMTTASFGGLIMAGSGTVTIDWGDGSKIETDTLQSDDDWDFADLYIHSYTGSTLCTITITGENVTYLNCSDKHLTSLDVSKNTVLRGLECWSNQLTSLDVSKNTALTSLSCSGNQLTSLDVSKNANLKDLICYENRLTSLDVSKNAALTSLSCMRNQLTSLDVSKNAALTGLGCSGNQLTSLDVSKNAALTSLVCFNNRLTSLDVSKNTKLTNLRCYGNQLTSLDVSKNAALSDLLCHINRLTSLDVSKNTVLTLLSCNDNQLTSNALNVLFETLHNNASEREKTIYIGGNLGTETCTRSIAEKKGWMIKYIFAER